MIKVCFVGLGSIGQRHIRNLTRLLEEKGTEYTIDAVRKGKKELPKEIQRVLHKEYEEIEQADCDYDIFFITNPTVYHLETIKKAMIHTRHMFIEKPVFRFPLCGEQELEESLQPQKGNIYYVACPLRYSECFAYMKKIVEKKKIYSVRCISTSYLPDWRKGTDYRECYSADAEKGGGVTLDLIHELDYLTDLFGMPDKSIHVKGRVSDLEINSDDISLYILQYKGKFIELHLDYFGRESKRQMELFCEDCVITCDFINSQIQYAYPDRTEKILVDKSDIYIKEMQNFMWMTEGKADNSNSMFRANEVLRLAVQGWEER